MPNISEPTQVQVPPESPNQDPKKGVTGNLTESLPNKIMDKMKNVAKKDNTQVGEKKPAYEGQQTEKLYNVKELTSNLTPKKIVKLLGLLVIVVIIIAAIYVRYIRKTPVRTVPTLTKIPTPTYSPFQKYKPSIYAEDANFKKIDEGINVLGNEVNNTPLEEQSLLPPNLDFNVDLK